MFIGHRWDHGYHAFEQLSFFDSWSKKFELVPLGKVIHDDSYGILTPGDVYSSTHPITYVRVTDMGDNLQIDFNQSLKVPEEYYRHSRARLKKNDVVLAVKGASIASNKSVAFIESEPPSKTIVNGTIFRFQVKSPHNPFYLAVMLDSQILKEQIRKLQIPNNAVAYIDKPSIHALLIPLPPPIIQDRIAQIMQDAYAKRRNKLAVSEQLYQTIEIHLLKELGIDISKFNNKRQSIKSISSIAGGRFDFEALVTLQEINFGLIKPVLLQKVVKQINQRVTPADEFANENINYIGLGNITSNTGELLYFSPIKGKAVLSSSPKFEFGDILFGRMRPYLNKVWLAKFDGICSGEAVVLRPNKQKVDPVFLQALLLSQLTLNQVVPLQSGTSLPRVSASDVLSIKLPIPEDLNQQRKISTEILRRRDEAKQLILEAEKLVIDAKARVERIILGEEEVT
ncbi:MAG TPA: restriction endonuclease subunit S [Leptolyngbyaceae cyanobacterium]